MCVLVGWLPWERDSRTSLGMPGARDGKVLVESNRQRINHSFYQNQCHGKERYRQRWRVSERVSEREREIPVSTARFRFHHVIAATCSLLTPMTSCDFDKRTYFREPQLSLLRRPDNDNDDGGKEETSPPPAPTLLSVPSNHDDPVVSCPWTRSVPNYRHSNGGCLFRHDDSTTRHYDSKKCRSFLEGTGECHW